jgi:hypothetical protein
MNGIDRRGRSVKFHFRRSQLREYGALTLLAEFIDQSFWVGMWERMIELKQVIMPVPTSFKCAYSALRRSHCVAVGFEHRCWHFAELFARVSIKTALLRLPLCQECDQLFAAANHIRESNFLAVYTPSFKTYDPE